MSGIRLRASVNGSYTPPAGDGESTPDDDSSETDSSSSPPRRGDTSGEDDEDDLKCSWFNGGRDRNASIFTGEPLERELRNKNIISGSKVLLCVIVMFTAAEMLVLFRVVVAGNSLRELLWAFGHVRLILHMVIQTSTVLSLLICLRRPRLFWYFVTITVWVGFTAIMWLFLPLENLQAFRAQNIEFFSADATGYIGLHGNMWLMFLLPLLIPERRFMSCFLRTWIGLFSIIMFTCIGVQSDGNTDMSEEVCTRSPAALRYQCNFDLSLGILILSAFWLVVSKRKKVMEEETLTNWQIDLRKKGVSRNMFQILSCMLPSFVIMPLLNDPDRTKPIAYSVDRASILFIMIVDFDQIVRSTSSPNRLLDFLNRYFTKIDEICAAHGVTKIETVGEEYVCAVGVGPDDYIIQQEQGHTCCVGQLVQVARKVLDLQYEYLDEEPVCFQMGIHTGPVVAGVVGQRLPRFRLFGDTINTAARMMQKGLPGKVQFGEATRRELPHWVEVEERGKVEMKGKGWVSTYLLHPGRNTSQRTNLSSGLVFHRRRNRHAITQMLIDVTEKEPGPMLTKNPTFEGLSFEAALETLAFSPKKAGSSTPTPRFGSATSLIWSKRQRRVNERDYRRWFHATCFYKNLARRIRKQMKWFVALTLMETLYMLSNSGAFSSRFFDVLNNFIVFLLCRLGCIVIIASWMNVVGRSRWVKGSPRWSQRWILLSWCCIVALAFISYDSLPFMFEPLESAKNNKFPLLGISRNPVFLFCFPVCMLVMEAHPFSFIQSCIFPILMVFVILLDNKLWVHRTLVLNNILIRILFLVSSVVRSVFACLHEANLRDRHASQLAVTRTLRKVEGILGTLMPPMVVQSLRDDSSEVRPQHMYTHATVVQSDLVGFTMLASTRSPQDVVQIISEIFGLFDKLADKHGIYKVETVGDAYIAGSAEKPLTGINSPLDVVLFGLEMVEATHKWSDKNGENVSCRVGVHTGECVGGIVGNDMQRYHLFGALMTGLGLLESTAPEGRVQASGACKRAVERDQEEEFLVPSRRVSFEGRRERELATSKGEVYSFAEVGGPTFLARRFI